MSLFKSNIVFLDNDVLIVAVRPLKLDLLSESTLMTNTFALTIIPEC